MAKNSANNLSAIKHVVLVMLENRSFDHMLGYLYTDKQNKSPTGQAFEGLTGSESNLDSSGKKVKVFKILPTTPDAYFMPGVNPGESYIRRNAQLFGNEKPPSAPPPPAKSNIGFVTDFEQRVAHPTTTNSGYVPDTPASNIMGCYAPETLPVLSGLAKGYAVCDHWFASVPSETMPNRAFALAGTSLGQINDPYGKNPNGGKTNPTFNTPSIFGALKKKGKSWRIYACGRNLTRYDFPDTNDKASCLSFTDFKNDARNGALPEFSLIEPAWDAPGRNDQHPISDVSAGEQLLADVYYALRTGKDWNSTLLIINYDESGGCYDHVPPPWGDEVVPPDDKRDPKYGFDFTRLGPRVPAVLVSPLIKAGTVFRVPDGAAPLEHTAIIKTVSDIWKLGGLQARDKSPKACNLGGAITLTTPRTDDPLHGVQVPHYSGPDPVASKTTHLQKAAADSLEAHPVFKKGKPTAKKVAGSRPTNPYAFDNYTRTLEQHIRKNTNVHGAVLKPAAKTKGKARKPTGK